MTQDGPILHTERLILRPPRVEDFDRFAQLHGDEQAARYIGGHVERAAAWRRFLWQPGAWSLQGFGMFSIIDKASGRWLGQAGPWRPEGWPGNEIGYSLHPDAWGLGYALEAAVAAIDWAFDSLDWQGIIHCIDPANEASKKVAAHLGSAHLRDGAMPPPYEDHHAEVWGQTRAQWHQSRERLVRHDPPTST